VNISPGPLSDVSALRLRFKRDGAKARNTPGGRRYQDSAIVTRFFVKFCWPVGFCAQDGRLPGNGDIELTPNAEAKRRRRVPAETFAAR
jgi:hypothetical protein